jgi:hypothetical protein
VGERQVEKLTVGGSARASDDKCHAIGVEAQSIAFVVSGRLARHCGSPCSTS